MQDCNGSRCLVASRSLLEAQKCESHVGFYKHRRFRDSMYNVLLALKKPGQVSSSGTVSPVHLAWLSRQNDQL